MFYLDSFDVGGTSTDVSRFDGKYEIVYETTTAGISIQSPQLDINTVRQITRPLMARSGPLLTAQNLTRRWLLEEVHVSPSVMACFRRAQRARGHIQVPPVIEKEGRWR